MNIKVQKIIREYCIALVLLGGVLLLFAWNSDFVQSRVNAQEYWTAKVEKGEEMVSFYEDQITSCRLEMMKLHRNQKIELQQRILEGMSGQEAIKDYIAEFEATRDSCDIFEGILEMERENVKESEQRLKSAILNNNAY